MNSDCWARVFDFLDGKSLLACTSVCRVWFSLANSPIRWKLLCEQTSRMLPGCLFNRSVEVYAEKYGWKYAFFWILPEELEVTNLIPLAERIDRLYDQHTAIRTKSPLEVRMKIEYLICRSIDLCKYPYNLPGFILTYTKFIFYDVPIVIGLLERAIGLNRLWDMDEVLRERLATYYSYAGLIDEAMRLYTELYNRTHLQFHARCLAIFLSDQGRYAEAGALMQNAGLLVEYGMLLWKHLQRFDDAEHVLRAAVEKNLYDEFYLVHFLCAMGKTHTVRGDDHFSMAMSYHHMRDYEKAIPLYRECESAKSNIAELLLHCKGDFDEAEKIYTELDQIAFGLDATCSVAKAGLILAKGDRENGLIEIDRCINAPWVRINQQELTSAHIIKLIHCFPEDEKEELLVLRQLLIERRIRPHLVVFFDANLRWAKEHKTEKYDGLVEIYRYYNSETFTEPFLFLQTRAEE